MALRIYEEDTDGEVGSRYEIEKETDSNGRVFFRAYRCSGPLTIRYLCEPQETFGGALHYLIKTLEDREGVDIEPAPVKEEEEEE